MCIRDSFDTGASDLFIRNARLLHIDLREVDYLILSHGHSDHTGGLRHFLELNTIATVVCKRSIFSPKFKDDRENGIKHTDTFDLSRFRFIDQRTELLPGVVLFPSIKIEDKEDTHFCLLYTSIFPSFTMTTPTLHTLVRLPLAVSKSIAAKFLI